MSKSNDGHDRRVGRQKNLVGFALGEVHYAIEIARVREIIHPLPVVVIPHAPPSVVGVADHRGSVVPVVDVRTRLSLPRIEVTRKTRWIVVEARTGRTALVVDGVSEVFGTSPEEQRSVPQLGVGDEARAITQVFSSAGRLVFVVDVDRIAEVARDVDVASYSGLAGSDA